MNCKATANGYILDAHSFQSLRENVGYQIAADKQDALFYVSLQWLT